MTCRRTPVAGLVAGTTRGSRTTVRMAAATSATAAASHCRPASARITGSQDQAATYVVKDSNCTRMPRSQPPNRRIAQSRPGTTSSQIMILMVTDASDRLPPLSVKSLGQSPVKSLEQDVVAPVAGDLQVARGQPVPLEAVLHQYPSASGRCRPACWPRPGAGPAPSNASRTIWPTAVEATPRPPTRPGRPSSRDWPTGTARGRWCSVSTGRRSGRPRRSRAAVRQPARGPPALSSIDPPLTVHRCSSSPAGTAPRARRYSRLARQQRGQFGGVRDGDQADGHPVMMPLGATSVRRASPRWSLPATRWTSTSRTPIRRSASTWSRVTGGTGSPGTAPRCRSAPSRVSAASR